MRWVREGAPVVQRGRRGRGCALLVDPAAVRRWRGADARDAVVMALAQVVPEILATATQDALQRTEGPHKRALAGCMVAAWYLGASAVLDHLRGIVAEVPEVTAPLPEPIERLRKIAASD
jgi:hypothetical protein